MRDAALLQAVMTVGDRIRMHREAADRSQQWLAERLGVNQNTVSGWERGRTEPSRSTVRKIARELGVDIAALELERVERVTHKARLMGYVGEGHEIEPTGDGEQVEVVGAPSNMPPGAEAAIVRGSSLYPWLHDGDVVTWWRWTPDPSPLIGRLCVCRRSDGKLFVKVVEPGSRQGVWTLGSLSSGYPPLRDVYLEAVAPIEVTNRREPTPPNARLPR